MKKTFVYYSILGCFATGAATASMLYVDFGGNCSGHAMCSVLPDAGTCCATNKTVSKVNLPDGANGWALSVGSNTIKIFNADGSLATLDQNTVNTIKNAAASSSSALGGAVIPASEQLVTVTLDMKGGSLPVGFTQTTRTMHPGDLIMAAANSRADGAKLVGFYKLGESPTTATPIITVGDAANQTYIATYSCSSDNRLSMNSKNTCVNSNAVYLAQDGTRVNPNDVDVTSTSGCHWSQKGTVTLHDFDANANNVPSNFAASMYHYRYRNSPEAANPLSYNNQWYSRYSSNYHEPYMFGYLDSERPLPTPSSISVSGGIVKVDNNQVDYLGAGAPNPNTRVLYCRGNSCWATEGGNDQPEVMYYINSGPGNDCPVCNEIDVNGEHCINYSYTKDGISYWYWQCPCDKQYTGIPGMSDDCMSVSLGCTNITTGSGTETQTDCVPNGIYTTAQQDLIWGLRQPKAVGWRFRGYYQKSSGADLFATSNTNIGAPLNGFGVGNPNNREIHIGSLTPIYVCVTDADADYNIHLYGAWAKECDPGTNANCSLSINGGDVQYTTSCNGNQSVINGTNGTYKPQCTADTSTVVDLNYSFVNQYGGTVNYTHSFDDNCTYSSNYNFLSANNFESNTDGYQLRYLKTNNKYYSPNRSVSCGQNVFGVNTSVDVVGFVCETCNAESGKSRCVSVTNDPSIVYNGSTPGYLWGANTSLGYDECKKLECETGYVLQLDSSTGRRYCKSENQVCLENCIAGCNGKPDCANSGNPQDYCSNYCEANAFVCPTNVDFKPGANLRIANVTKTPGQKECTYTIACNGDGAVQNTSITYPWRFNDIPSDEDTSEYEGDTMEITCSGDGNDADACVTDKLNDRLYSLSCFTCPNYNGADPSVSPALPQQEGLVCSYNIYCNGRVSFPRTLTKNSVPVANCNKDTVRCIAHNCTDGYGTYSTRYYLTTEFGKYMCTTGADGLSSEEERQCGGGGLEQFFCPESLIGQNGVIVTPDPGNASSTNICKYTLSCSNNYQLSYNNGDGSGLNLITCTGTACSVPNLSTIIDEYSCVGNSK